MTAQLTLALVGGTGLNEHGVGVESLVVDTPNKTSSPVL